jgi:hypothetical protein
VSGWFAAFCLSLVVEVPIYLALLGTPWPRRVCAAFGTTLLTHPYVWFVLPNPLIPVLGYWGYVVVAEVLVVLVETGVCVCLDSPPKRALLAAGLANAASYGVGVLLLR